MNEHRRAVGRARVDSHTSLDIAARFVLHFSPVHTFAVRSRRQPRPGYWWAGDKDSAFDGSVFGERYWPHWPRDFVHSRESITAYPEFKDYFVSKLGLRI